MADRPDNAQHQPGAGRGGVVPPAEHRFKPGQSGNPAGRPPAAGATIREWINTLADQGLDEVQLRKVGRDKKASWAKRAAAERMLRVLEAGDLADFQPLIRGEKTLEELRADGVNTEVIKRFKVKSRVVPAGNGAEEQIEREVELHDRAGADFDRIMDRTEGKPKQSVEMTHDGAIRTLADGQTAADQALDRLRAALGAGAGDAG